jgi:hypothetical protein
VGRHRLRRVCFSVDDDTYRVIRSLRRGDRSAILRRIISKIR